MREICYMKSWCNFRQFSEFDGGLIWKGSLFTSKLTPTVLHCADNWQYIALNDNQNFTLPNTGFQTKDLICHSWPICDKYTLMGWSDVTQIAGVGKWAKIITVYLSNIVSVPFGINSLASWRWGNIFLKYNFQTHYRE